MSYESEKHSQRLFFFIIIIIMCRTINSRSGHRGGRVVRWSWVNFQCRASYNLDDSRARAYCACSRCGCGCLDIFTLLYLFSPLSPSLWETARHRLKYCPKRHLNPKQPTVQAITSTFMHGSHRDYYMGFFLYHVYEPETPVSDRGPIAWVITKNSHVI